ncbi:MAG: YceH family protein [Burkholderiaceae bacterium]
MTTHLRPLTPVEARVLGTLMEKARTVPDSYPMSMQALLTGCNQKTTRDPVMNLTESQVADAIDELKGLALVVEQSGARVPRYSHNFMRGVGVPDQSAVLLGLLMLRGPQTAGELRINSERWHRFADISSVDAFLEELQDRSDDKGGPLVVKLPRAPGAREQRWAHLMCGEVDMGQHAAAPGTTGAAEEDVIALTRRVAALEDEVSALRQTVANLCAQLGVTPTGT